MKKLLFAIATLFLITGTTVAQDKKKEKASCDSTAKGAACCKQPSKTASLRTAAKKPVKQIKK